MTASSINLHGNASSGLYSHIIMTVSVNVRWIFEYNVEFDAVLYD